MLKAIRSLFDTASLEQEVDHEHRFHLAAAVLLWEVAKSDHQVEPAELRYLEQVLQEQWRLDDGALAELMEVASREADLAASLHEQVEVVNRGFSQQQKYDLLRGLWQVACSDGRIHHHEEHLVRRIADLLYIPHSEFIRAKHQALATPE